MAFQNYVIASVDPGRNKTKSMLLDGTTFDFPSFISEYRDRNFSVQSEHDMIVELGYNGEKGAYFVGKLARREGLDASQAFRDSKAHEQTVLLILTALHQLGVYGNVKVATCVPITNHKKDGKRLKELLIGEHWVTLNEDKRRINITDVFITIEGGASYFAIPEEETIGKIARVINIGSAKSNFGTFDEEGIFIDAQSGSLDKIGWEKFDQIGDHNISKLTKATYDELCRKQWDKPMVDEYGNELKQIFYLGGGVAEKLESEFKKYFPTISIIPDPLYSDCLGTLQAAVMHWEG